MNWFQDPDRYTASKHVELMVMVTKSGGLQKSSVEIIHQFFSTLMLRIGRTNVLILRSISFSTVLFHSVSVFPDFFFLVKGRNILPPKICWKIIVVPWPFSRLPNQLANSVAYGAHYMKPIHTFANRIQRGISRISTSSPHCSIHTISCSLSNRDMRSASKPVGCSLMQQRNTADICRRSPSGQFLSDRQQERTLHAHNHFGTCRGTTLWYDTYVVNTRVTPISYVCVAYMARSVWFRSLHVRNPQQ